MAALQAIIFCKEMGFDNILFEGFGMQEHEGMCLSCYGHYIEGIKHELCGFGKASFNHVCRDANNAAHVLAKLAATHVTMSTWLEDIPPNLGDIVRREQPLLLL